MNSKTLLILILVVLIVGFIAFKSMNVTQEPEAHSGNEVKQETSDNKADQLVNYRNTYDYNAFMNEPTVTKALGQLDKETLDTLKTNLAIRSSIEYVDDFYLIIGNKDQKNTKDFACFIINQYGQFYVCIVSNADIKVLTNTDTIYEKDMPQKIRDWIADKKNNLEIDKVYFKRVK